MTPEEIAERTYWQTRYIALREIMANDHSWFAKRTDYEDLASAISEARSHITATIRRYDT